METWDRLFSEAMKTLGHVGLDQTNTSFQIINPSQKILSNLVKEQRAIGPQSTIVKIDKLIVEFPRSPLLYKLKSAVSASMLDYSTALQSIEKAIEINAKDAESHKNKTILLLKERMFENAFVSISNAILLKPNYTEALILLAQLSEQLSFSMLAEATYQKILELDGNSKIAFKGLGDIFLLRNNLCKAEKEYQKALKSDPEYVEALNNLGVTLKRQGKLSEAIKIFQSSIKLKATQSEAHNNLGVTLQEIGDERKAKLYFQDVIIRENTNITALCNYSTNELDFNEANLTLKRVDYLITKNQGENCIKLLFAKASILLQLNETQHAFKVLMTANSEKRRLIDHEYKQFLNFRVNYKDEFSNWCPVPKVKNDTQLKVIFLLGASRSGKSFLERILSKNRVFFPMYEGIILEKLQHPKDYSEQIPYFNNIFYHDASHILRNKFAVCTTTNPSSIYFIKHIYENLENVSFVWVNRSNLDVGAEIFSKYYSNGHHYAYNASEILSHLEFIKQIRELTAAKLPNNTFQIDIDCSEYTLGEQLKKMGEWLNLEVTHPEEQHLKIQSNRYRELFGNIVNTKTWSN